MTKEALVQEYLADAISSFRAYKKLAEKAIEQLSEPQLFITLDDESNSIAIIMKHMAGNMLSRWTDFLNSDGEKPDRDRDSEFVISAGTTKKEALAYWQRGWEAVFAAVEPLQAADFEKTVSIRGECHTIVQAINRQIAHYAYHVGQIVFLAKHFRSAEWESLSIPRNRSNAFNAYLGESAKQGSTMEDRLDQVSEFANSQPDER